LVWIYVNHFETKAVHLFAGPDFWDVLDIKNQACELRRERLTSNFDEMKFFELLRISWQAFFAADEAKA